MLYLQVIETSMICVQGTHWWYFDVIYRHRVSEKKCYSSVFFYFRNFTTGVKHIGMFWGAFNMLSGASHNAYGINWLHYPSKTYFLSPQ